MKISILELRLERFMPPPPLMTAAAAWWSPRSMLGWRLPRLEPGSDMVTFWKCRYKGESWIWLSSKDDDDLNLSNVDINRVVNNHHHFCPVVFFFADCILYTYNLSSNHRKGRRFPHWDERGKKCGKKLVRSFYDRVPHVYSVTPRSSKSNPDIFFWRNII